MNQVDTDIVEPGVPGSRKGRHGLTGGMGPAEPFQESVVKRLDSEGKTIDSRCPERDKFRTAHRARITFQGNFRICGKSVMLCRGVDEPLHLRSLKEGRCSAADVEGDGGRSLFRHPGAQRHFPEQPSQILIGGAGSIAA